MAAKRKAAALKASDLKPAPYNPRRISPDALAGLGQSVESFGDLSGIVWNRRTGFLVCGHQRIEALRQRGAEWKEGGFELNGERFPVRVVDWDEMTERAANVSANNPYIAGEFDDGLAAILESLSSELPEFDALRLDDLLSAPPDFCATGEDDQPRLDEVDPIICPKCGYSWQK